MSPWWLRDCSVPSVSVPGEEKDSVWAVFGSAEPLKGALVYQDSPSVFAPAAGITYPTRTANRF